MEQNFFEPEAGYETDRDVLLKQKWSPISAPTSASENDCSSFECNICLDSARDPMVTLCGHLYCWPCIYKWLHVQTSSLDADEQRQKCPVCKANISVTSLVPLYGRGTSSESKSKKNNLGMVVPSRPHPSVWSTSVTSSNTSTRHRSQRTSVTSSNTSTRHRSQRLHSEFFQSQAPSFHNPQYFPHHYGGHLALPSSSLGGMAISFFNPLIGIFGGMTLERIFGGSGTSLFPYPSHPPLVSNNPRIRRQEMELDKSLSRVSMFLFCCLILCLLLF